MRIQRRNQSQIEPKDGQKHSHPTFGTSQLRLNHGNSGVIALKRLVEERNLPCWIGSGNVGACGRGIGYKELEEPNR